MVKARGSTRDKLGVTAELPAVVEEKGHLHPSSVNACFCCKVCLQRYVVSARF